MNQARVGYCACSLMVEFVVMLFFGVYKLCGLEQASLPDVRDVDSDE